MKDELRLPLAILLNGLHERDPFMTARMTAHADLDEGAAGKGRRPERKTCGGIAGGTRQRKIVDSRDWRHALPSHAGTDLAIGKAPKYRKIPVTRHHHAVVAMPRRRMNAELTPASSPLMGS
ncbi:MAG TPA: hypothetical protein VFZ31_07620 [Vicinamibacterales bacterium]